MRGLQGKRVIVTGGGSGIGREVCKRFAEEGSEVAVFDLNAEGAAETVSLIEANGGKASAHTVDIADRAAVDAAVAAFEAGGPVDVLVNNAGWDLIKPFLDTDMDLWKKVIDINLYGPLNMHHAVLPGMVKNGGGRVVNISSDAGRVGSSGEAVYSACKGGIISFTKTVARELARKGIHAFCRSRQGRGGRKDRRRSEAGHPDETSGPAHRLSRHHLFPFVRRRRVHHGSGHFRIRWPVNAWLNALGRHCRPPEGEQTPHNWSRSSAAFFSQGPICLILPTISAQTALLPVF